MAIYHFNAKIITKSNGHSIIAAAAYRSGQKLYDQTANKMYDYSKKVGVVYSSILAPKNVPDWINHREKLWNQVNKIEKRTDAQTARDITLALPKELTLEEQIKLVKQFCQTCFVQEGMVADLNIHHDNPENPHAHILLTTRNLSSTGFSLKNRAWNNKKVLIDWREKWGTLANQYLNENAYANITIDHRTLKAQGIDNQPQIHVGKNATHANKKGIKTERTMKNEMIKKARQKSIQQESGIVFKNKNRFFNHNEKTGRTDETINKNKSSNNHSIN